MSHRLVLSSLFLAAAACGGGSGGDVDPAIVEGGGVRNPGVDGKMHVHVIDEDTDEPIEGATVHVGETSVETDATGLATFTDVSGPQTITAVASAHVTATWVGVDGANVTIPLGTNTTPTDFPQGTVTGTIEGWADMDPPFGTALVALTSYSWNGDDDDPANQIMQPTGDPAPDTCVKLSDEACNWSVDTRTGTMTMFAFIGNIDSQMSLELTGFAYAQGVSVDDGETVSGITLEVAGASDLVTPDLTLPSAPAGTDRVDTLIRMNLGEDDRLVLPQTAELSVPVPAASVFPGSDYDIIAIAQTDAAEGGPQSIRIERGVADVDGASVGSFLAVPGGVETDATDFNFTAIADATVHTFEVTETDGDVAWAVGVFDDSTTVTRPAAVTLPNGSLTFRVTAIDVPGLDVRDFSLEAIEDQVVRASSDGVTFTN
jgi:hypothetical protein